MSSIAQGGGVYDDVYLGFWTNWSHGKVRGATITLTQNNGGLLIAFVALFVGAAGKSFWRLLCFALHRLLSAPTVPQDGLYHQRQAILRNSESAFQGGWQLFKSMLAWKRSHAAQGAIRRSIPIAVTAIVVSCGFAVAGIFSSRISTGDANEVLLSGKKCGVILPELNRTAFYNGYQPWSSQRTQEHATYARSCYGNSSDARACNLYVKPSLRLASDRNASCPFSESICHSKFGNLELDTGYINTNDDLGINSPPSERFLMRHIHRCAPLKTEGFSNVYNWVDPMGGRTTPKATTTAAQLFRLFYGGYAGYSHFMPTYSNFTYEFPINSTRAFFHPGSDLTGPAPDYVLGIAMYRANLDYDLNVTFVPIPELQYPDADIHIFFLSAPDLSFTHKVDDPWFSAHQRSGSISSGKDGFEESSTYSKDIPVSAVACASQFQFCRSEAKIDSEESIKKHCTQPRGEKAGIQFKDEGFAGREKQMFEFWRRQYRDNALTFLSVVQSLKASFLIARASLSQSNQGKLPKNQWQIEMENMAGAVLSSAQGHLVDTVRGPPVKELEQVWFPVPKNDTAAWSVCNGQKILNSRYPSFNVLGLSLILGIGGILILLDLFLEATISRIQDLNLFRRNKKQASADFESKLGFNFRGETFNNFNATTSRTDTDTTFAAPPPDIMLLKRAEWNVNSTLQLQRLAHEGVGFGTWKRTSDETPVTLPNEPLGVLDFKDSAPAHPHLVRAFTAPEMLTKAKPSFQPNPSPLNRYSGISSIHTVAGVGAASHGRSWNPDERNK